MSLIAENFSESERGRSRILRASTKRTKRDFAALSADVVARDVLTSSLRCCVIAVPLSRVRLIPAKVSFVQVPTDTAVPVGTEATLKCVTSSRVEKCTWTWRPLHSNDPEIVVEEFPSNSDLGRDCSLYFPHVYTEKQGLWGCQVSIASLSTVLTSPAVKLTVFEQGERPTTTLLYISSTHSY